MIKGLHHIAIAVQDLSDTARFYQDTFGLAPPEKLEVIPDQGVKACLINLGNAYIELLEPLGDDSALARFLSRNGEGLHHLCLETDDVNQELLRLASQGLDLVDRAARPGIAGMIGFIHPKSTRGTLIELVQLKGDGIAMAAEIDGRKIRVLVAKPGLDGHDRGAKVVARALRDAGMEVIYTGIRQSPEMIAEAALQEDVNAVGISILSGAHMELCPRIMELLQAKGLSNVSVFVGGIIPDEDAEVLKQKGVKGVFGPGTSTGEIIDFVRTTTLEQD